MSKQREYAETNSQQKHRYTPKLYQSRLYLSSFCVFVTVSFPISHLLIISQEQNYMEKKTKTNCLHSTQNLFVDIFCSYSDTKGKQKILALPHEHFMVSLVSLVLFKLQDNLIFRICKTQFFPSCVKMKWRVQYIAFFILNIVVAIVGSCLLYRSSKGYTESKAKLLIQLNRCFIATYLV